MCFYYFLNIPVVTAHTEDVHYGFICGIFIANKKMGGEFKHSMIFKICMYTQRRGGTVLNTQAA